MPVTTKMPAPMEAPTPIRTRSNRPSRRTSPSPEFVRTADSEGGGRVLDRRAEDQKFEQNDDDEGKVNEDEPEAFSGRPSIKYDGAPLPAGVS